MTEHRIPKWWERWVNPTTLLALFGGIVWGVQLNMLVTVHATKLGGQASAIYRNSEDINTIDKTLARMVTLMEVMNTKVDDLYTSYDAHLEDSVEIREKILRNEYRNGHNIP